MRATPFSKMDPRRCATHCNKGILRVPLILLSVLILVGLLINSRFFTRKDDGLVNEPARVPEAPIPILERPVTPSSLEDDVEYIRSYLSKEGLVKRVDNPTNWLNITCDNSTENFALYYLYARGQDQNHYNAPLTCEETFRRSICPGNQYLEDLRLRSILSNVSEYLTYNVLTENDLRMASLALEFKYQPRIDYQPNYKDPRIAYLLMSAHSPWFLQYSIDQIRKNARNETIMYTTFDYNSKVLERFNETITANPDLKVLPTRWLGNWGGISLVYLEVNAWLELLKVDGWDYIINLSDSDGFVIPANIVEQNVKDLSGQSIIECPYGFVYSQGYNDSCIHANAAYRYTNVWIDCGSKIRGTNSHPMLKPIFPKYTIPSIKASQWKVFSRSVIEKLVTSQDFWDILFSYRYSLVPDEHVIINAVKRILPKEKFIYHNVHNKNWTAKPVDEKMITEAMGSKAWFIRKIDKKEQFETLARLREERYGRL